MKHDDRFRLGKWDKDLIRVTRNALGLILERPGLAAATIGRLRELDAALARLPARTPDLDISLRLFSRQVTEHETLENGWSLEASHGALVFDVGGYEDGPQGCDSFSRFNYALYVGCKGEGDPDLSVWIEGFPDVARAGWQLEIE